MTGRFSISWFKEYARNEGGRCLSNTYTNAWSSLRFECAKGHKWETVARNLRRGSWCPVCGGSYPLTLGFFQTLAKERGGVCLTKQYRNQRQSLTFRCENGHVFRKEANAIRNTLQWCPQCSQNIGERVCRIAFETLFGGKFERAWPAWLRNSRGQPMELDGYNARLRVAFEHQGEQHYSLMSHYITTKDKLSERKRDDRRKYYLATKHGVHLFRIPQVPQRISSERLIKYVARHAKTRGLRLRPHWEDATIDFDSVFHGYGKKRLAACRELAVQRDGRFLSTEWKGEEYNYLWECSQGHQWRTKVRNIRKGNWCKQCSGKAKLTIEVYQKFAKAKGGVCLSRRYRSAHQKLRFKCAVGHVFYSSGSNVKNLGRWCPQCAGKKKLTIMELREIAKARGGRCLSTVYVNNKTKLQWECAVGHRWVASAQKIRQGQWCPICGRKRIWKTRRARQFGGVM